MRCVGVGLVCVVGRRRWRNPGHPRVVVQGSEKGCWGPKGHVFWCHCLLIQVV